jgi:hypothetical protein
MTTPPSANDVTNINKYAFPLLLALISAGLVGNHFNFEIFLNINFLFGSIFAMLVLQFFGLKGQSVGNLTTGPRTYSIIKRNLRELRYTTTCLD